MKRLPGVLLFLILVLVLLQILTMRVLSSTGKRVTILEKKVESLQPAVQQPAAPAK
ncbi:MAG: hypothetical protein QM715_07840 [Nibricoccus sp.]